MVCPPASPLTPGLNMGSFHSGAGGRSGQQSRQLRLPRVRSLVLVCLSPPAGEKIMGLGMTEVCPGGQGPWFTVWTLLWWVTLNKSPVFLHFRLLVSKEGGAMTPSSCLLDGLWIGGSLLYPTRLPVGIVQDSGFVMHSLCVITQGFDPFSQH